MNDLTLTLLNQIAEMERRIIQLERLVDLASNYPPDPNQPRIKQPHPYEVATLSILREKVKYQEEEIKGLKAQIKELKDKEEYLSHKLGIEREVTRYQQEEINKYKRHAPENNRQWWQFKGWD